MTAQPTALPTFKNLARDEGIEKSISVALVGYGRQGEMIADALIHIPGVHVAAIADIWPWRRQLASEKKLLVQCGHQRRSNPRYVYVFDKLNHENKIPGTVTHAYTQWHRGIAPLIRVPDRLAMSTADLQRHGYESMEQLLNWEWFSHFGLGDVGYRTGQKLDLLRWFWDAEPCSVTAIGGNDYYNREAPDCLMSIFNFKLPTGKIRRGYVQVLSTNSSGGDIEIFGANKSKLQISEVPMKFQLICSCSTYGYFEDSEVNERVLTLIKGGMLLTHKKAPPREITNKVSLDVRDDSVEKELLLPFQPTSSPIQPHLENFISAIRDGTKLRDPIEQASKNLIALEAAMQSARERRTIDLPNADRDRR